MCDITDTRPPRGRMRWDRDWATESVLACVGEQWGGVSRFLGPFPLASFCGTVSRVGVKACGMLLKVQSGARRLGEDSKVGDLGGRKWDRDGGMTSLSSLISALTDEPRQLSLWAWAPKLGRQA